MNVRRGVDHAREDGFTLLELLVAMTLLGLLTIVMFSGLRFGTQAWAKAQAVTADANQVQSLQNLLANALTRAYPAFIMKIPTDAHVDFEGDKTTMRFLAPDPAGSGAMMRMTVAAQEDKDHVALSVTATPELATNPQPHRIGPLLGGFKTLAFAYYGADDAKNGPYWHDGWRDRSKLPELVRIQGTFVKGMDVTWPDLVVAPHIGADESCVFDLLTHFCQGR